MKNRRSVLLVPASNGRLVEKARAIAADSVVLDLEDSVPPDDNAKSRARERVANALSDRQFRAAEVAVRVNGITSRWFKDDLAVVIDGNADSIILPHTYGYEHVAAAEQAIAAITNDKGIDVVLAVETPATLLELETIARESRFVTGLAVGPNDYALEIGSSVVAEAFAAGSFAVRADAHLSWLRAKIVAVAAAMKWAAIDAPIVDDPKDADQVRGAMIGARRMGFDGCAVMFPAHVDIANEVFSPSEDELAWARRIIECYEAGQGEEWPELSGGRVVLHQHYEAALMVRDRARPAESGA